jgi:hypothetical protein
MKPIDELYTYYSQGEFEQIVVDNIVEPELAEFVEKTKIDGPRFNSYPKDKLEYFARRIYELRKNYPDNTSR